VVEMSDNDKLHFTGMREKSNWKMSLQKLVYGTVQTWHGVVVRSRHEQPWPEKLGRQKSSTMYDRPSVMMTMQTGGDFEPCKYKEKW